MNVQMKKLSLAIMLGILGGMPLAVYAESQVDDEIINNTSPDIELNNTATNGADWEISNGTGCNSATCLAEALSFVSEDGGTGSIGLQIENGAGTNALPAVTIDSAGRVGILDENPTEELTISSSVPGIRLNDTSAGAFDFMLRANTSSFHIEDAGGNNILSIEGNATNTPLYLDSDGDVGVQVSNPIADLQVGGGGDILLENGTEDWHLYSDTNEFILRNGNNTLTGSVPFRLWNQAPSNSLAIRDTGFVGFGTLNPAADMHIRRSGADMLIEDINGATGIRNLLELRNKGPVGFKLRDTTGAEDWAFRTGGGGSFIATKSDISGPVMSFGGDGSVSLGQNPGSPGTTSNMFLSPVGNLTIQGAFMTPFNTYADYVFASDYKLMPLDELQTFVKANKHLPNVLSEAEVKKTNMINVSELQITQLAKIEELTLYTLQQHQQIKALQASKDSPNELANVAIIATKELQKKSEAMDADLKAETVALKAENASLKQRLASLEKLVTNLASGQNLLPEKGDKVVLK